MTTIGVISDTHGLVRPEIVALLQGVDLIIHAGDIGSQDVITAIEKIAPVTAIRGNIDKGDWAKSYPDEEVVRVDGRSIYMLHNLRDMNLDPVAAGYDIVVSGHSHKPKTETVNGVLYLNPGSAGPRRFSLPIALATLRLGEDEPAVEIHEIAAPKR